MTDQRAEPSSLPTDSDRLEFSGIGSSSAWMGWASEASLEAVTPDHVCRDE